MKQRIGFVWLASLAVSVLPSSAFAAFHLMQIDQVIGGVGGDTTAQAVELKMRAASQSFLNGAVRLTVYDPNDNNPVTLSIFPANLSSTAPACTPILIATPNFVATALKSPTTAVADYTMNPIPPGYLAGGTLRFENTTGTTVYWRLSWGTYAGAGTVIGGTNDDNTTMNPPFGGVLQSSDAESVKFTPACGTTSTTNAAQYALSGTGAVFQNAAGNTLAAATPTPSLPGSARWLLPGLLGLGVLAFATLRRRREG